MSLNIEIGEECSESKVLEILAPVQHKRRLKQCVHVFREETREQDMGMVRKFIHHRVTAMSQSVPDHFLKEAHYTSLVLVPAVKPQALEVRGLQD